MKNSNNGTLAPADPDVSDTIGGKGKLIEHVESKSKGEQGTNCTNSDNSDSLDDETSGKEGQYVAQFFGAPGHFPTMLTPAMEQAGIEKAERRYAGEQGASYTHI